MSLAQLDSPKIEVQKQWDGNPCGADTVQGIDRDTLAYYRAIRNHRYTEYAPWMDDIFRFDRRTNQDILEIGVGVGSDHYRWAAAGNRLTALDLSREHLRHTTQHLELEGLITSPHYGDAEDLPFDDASFDCVYSFGVLHHTPNTEAAIAEVHRVLRPGGTAIIGVYHLHSFFYWISTMLVQGVIKLGWPRKGYRRLMSEIEYRDASNDAVPLVKVYSRRQARRLFSMFSDVRVRTCHVEASHFSRLGRLFGSVRRATLEKYLSAGGWYVVVEAVK